MNVTKLETLKKKDRQRKISVGPYKQWLSQAHSEVQDGPDDEREVNGGIIIHG